MNPFLCQLNYEIGIQFTCHYEKQKFYENDMYTLVWQGKIYNKEQLEKLAKDLGISHTEESIEHTMISLFTHLNTELFIKLHGKFALIIWDKENKTFYGVRDHFGIESLYYTEVNNHLYVTNFKRELRDINHLDTSINDEALQHYFTLQYVPEPLSLMNNIYKLRAGHYIIKRAGEPIEEVAYFVPTFTPAYYSKEQKTNDIQQNLYESINERIPKNKPIGTFLSGGIDSTIITAMAQKINPNIKAYTMGFSEKGFSEVDQAARTAQSLGIEHKEIIITPGEFIAALPAMIYHLEDPLADPSAVPLYIGCQEVSEDIDVLLSGEGADEMFGGYGIYREYKSLEIFNYIPRLLKRPILNLSQRMPEGMKGKSFLYRGLTSLKNRYVGNAKIFEETEKQHLLHNYCPSNQSKYWMEPYFNQVADKHPMEQMQYIDWNTWLPGDILFKASRLSAGADVSIRLPFVDQKIYNIARLLTVEDKITKKHTKAILREAAEGIIPNHVLEEEKRAFPVPLKRWLRHDLYVWAHRQITNAKTGELINKDYAINLLHEHSRGKHDYSRKLWAIIIFNLWYEIFVENTNLLEEPWHLSII